MPLQGPQPEQSAGRHCTVPLVYVCERVCVCASTQLLNSIEPTRKHHPTTTAAQLGFYCVRAPGPWPHLRGSVVAGEAASASILRICTGGGGGDKGVCGEGVCGEDGVSGEVGVEVGVER